MMVIPERVMHTELDCRNDMGKIKTFEVDGI
jgi:hypothetical protein